MAVNRHGYVVSPYTPRRTRRLVDVARGQHLPIPAGIKVYAWTVGRAHVALIRSFQHHNRLPITGQFDAATLRLLFPPKPKALKRDAALKVALSYVGTRESPSGSNRGPVVDKFIKAGEGRVVAESWCADFVTYCDKAAGIAIPDFYHPRALAWYEMAKAGRGGWKTVGFADAAAGDRVVFQFGSDNHIGRFLHWQDLPSGRYVCTVDGNSNDMVRVALRPASTIVGIVRSPE